MKPKRPALRYTGGKWLLAPWIISFFPSHIRYVEPYCGACSVLLRKQPSFIEVVNDIDSEIVNFFTVLRQCSEDLVKLIDLTPFSREEYMDACRPKETNPIERARRLYVRCWQGRGPSCRSSGWRFLLSDNIGTTSVKSWSNTEYLYDVAHRLKEVYVENDDAFKVIQRYDTPETLFYVDPPYLLETRTGKIYDHEVDDNHHEKLLNLLLSIQGMAIISGYPSPMYDSILVDWKKEEKLARTLNPENFKQEVLWISPSAVEALNMPQQLKFDLD